MRIRGAIRNIMVVNWGGRERYLKEEVGSRTRIVICAI